MSRRPRVYGHSAVQFEDLTWACQCGVALVATSRAKAKQELWEHVGPIAAEAEQKRHHIATMYTLRLWPLLEIAAAYEVDVDTVNDCADRYGLKMGKRYSTR